MWQVSHITFKLSPSHSSHNLSLRALARSNSPCTRLPSLSACIFLSKTCAAGVFFFGIHPLPPPLLSCLVAFNADRSTTFGDDENRRTSRYRIFVSVASARSVGGVLVTFLSSSSSSPSESVSDNPEGTNGGVGGRCAGTASGGRASISRRRS